MDSIKRNQATVAQIKRLEDAPNNPLTDKPWPAGHKTILEGRRRLPVYEKFGDILDAYHQNQVFVLASETGSGKSTQIPQLLVYDEYEGGLRIACTQPRRLAATSLAQRVATEMGVVLGEEVGYQIGGDKNVDLHKKKTRLMYVTEGVLLGKQVSDKDLSAYSCIIIDEAHERTVETDLLLATLKKILVRRKDLKVVIMSATMDATLFQEYFNQCPLVHITGRNFKVDTLYTGPGNALSNFSVLAANTVVHIHKTTDKASGDILVFLPGQGEIGQVCGMVREYTKDLDVYPLYSTMAATEQSQAILSSGANRKCIVSTNIAETSLTIENVVYVVDTGLSRQLIYNPRLAMNSLQMLPISQASAKQRTGRAGRTRDGVCYRLYSNQDFDRLSLSTEPTIRTSSVHSAILRLGATGGVRVIDWDWLDAPHPESIARAAQDLQDWGFLNNDGLVTASGRKAARFGLDPIWYHAIEVGAGLGCSLDILDIAVLCSSLKPIFSNVTRYQHAADASNAASAVAESDHLALAHALNQYLWVWKQLGEPKSPCSDLRAWCQRNFLDCDALESARNTRTRLGRALKEAKLQPSLAPSDDLHCVPKALAIAFCTQLAIYHDDSDGYRTVHENTNARLAPLSSLVDGNSEWVVYNNLSRSGGKVYLETVTSVCADWLVDLPFFQTDRMPLKGDGNTLRQPRVKKSLDAARAKIEASKTE